MISPGDEAGRPARPPAGLIVCASDRSGNSGTSLYLGEIPPSGCESVWLKCSDLRTLTTPCGGEVLHSCSKMSRTKRPM